MNWKERGRTSRSELKGWQENKMARYEVVIVTDEALQGVSLAGRD